MAYATETVDLRKSSIKLRHAMRWRVILNTVMHHSSTSIYVPNFI